MPEAQTLLVFDKPHMTVRLYEKMLKIDLKGSFRNELEEALENTPVLRETIGSVLEMFAPLHVRLCDIESARMDKKGKVTIKQPRHRDLIVPLEPKEAKKLIDKLNELIPIEKQRELERIIKEHKLGAHERELEKEEMPLSSSESPTRIPPPPGVWEEERKPGEEQDR
jgi:mRNA-degrading endonuclease YafQ of YafQ-DinJ toxin-antitoxin module